MKKEEHSVGVVDAAEAGKKADENTESIVSARLNSAFTNTLLFCFCYINL